MQKQPGKSMDEIKTDFMQPIEATFLPGMG
jgi:hypothetical protein